MFPLHQAARDERDGMEVAARVEQSLCEGCDPHAMDESGETAFNVAAPASPVSGRLMTNHWLSLALEGRGAKGLNDRSGAHGSTLAQYIAKWSDDSEIEAQIETGLAQGMIVDRPNASGWTPLIAAAAMGRVKAVEVFTRHYSEAALLIKTVEEYKTSYGGHAVVYAAGLTAEAVAAVRLVQDHGLAAKQKQDLIACMHILAKRPR